VVAVELEGADDAPGVKEGGVLDQVTRELNIEALPTDIPERIVVDVSHMDIGSTLSLAEVGSDSGVEFLDDPQETTIATLVPPTVEEDPEIEAETGLVGEEPAEAAEGEGSDGESGDSGDAE